MEEKNVKYPIILEKPTTRVVVEFLLKQFGIRISGSTKVFLCQKETCEVDLDVPVTNYGANAASEHFICVFSLDKQKGIVPLLPFKEMSEKLVSGSWPEADQTIRDVVKECTIKPDFIITYGRLQMPSGISEMCWCIHEILQDNESGIFDSKATVPEVVQLFTEYLWTLANLSKLSPETAKKSCDEVADENAEPAEIADVFRVEDVILYVLDQVPFEKQKKLCKCFCQKKPEFEEYLAKIDDWNLKTLRTFILQHDVLNYFESYREMIVEAMQQMMPDEGLIDPIGDEA